MFSLRCYVALLRLWRRRCFHGINAMILMPQIFDVTANENARNKPNELEYSFMIRQWLCILNVNHDINVWRMLTTDAIHYTTSHCASRVSSMCSICSMAHFLCGFCSSLVAVQIFSNSNTKRSYNALNYLHKCTNMSTVCMHLNIRFSFYSMHRWFSVSYFSIESKKEVPRDARNSKVRKHDKFRWDWSRHQNACKSKCGTGPGVQRSKRPLLACHIRCKCSMEISHN